MDEFDGAGLVPGGVHDDREIVGEELRLSERLEQGDRAKVEWLRSAAKEGFDQLDRGEGIEFKSMDAFDAWMDELGDEVSAELAAEQVRG